MNIFRSIIVCVLILFFAECSSADNEYTFTGQIDFTKKEFNIALRLGEESFVIANAQKISDSEYRIFLDIDHLKTPLFDLQSKVESTIEVRNKESDVSLGMLAGTSLWGKVWSQYSLVDYKPIRELSGSFEIKDSSIQVNSLSFGNLQCSGTVDLRSPYKIDLAFQLYDVAMDDFLNFWGSGKKYEASGTVSGEIKAGGTIGSLALRGNLESRNGFVQTLNYDVISLNIEGIYPHMKITSSTISKSDGVSFSFNGPLDLKDTKNFKKQIKALTLSPLVSDSGSEMEWTIRRLNPDAQETTELKYHMRKGDALGTGTSVGDEIDMLGIEKKRKF